ncbi:PLP-dependent aminotransferase family protein [Actinomadura meridiana]|uniref:PLP-dependent aminotransferase family protein n=1 Tax=Actinomadura meridiana TaxID=559626 RepID=A0ABP8CEV3_9ACTN
MDRFRDPADLLAVLGDWMTGRGPLYRKLAAALRHAVQDGALLPGDRLPSERDLAGLLAVSRSTVVAAYDQLRSEGLVDSRQGSGTRVTERPGTPRPDGRVRGGTATPIFQRLIDGPGDLISLAFATEPAVDGLQECLLDLVRDDLPALTSDTGYHPRGLPVLLEALAERFTAMGLPTSTDQLLVTTGATQALVLAAQLYLRPGATVIVESPSWAGCLDVFRASGATLKGIPLDEEGMDVGALGKALADSPAALVYVTPTFHNPTGTLMSASRRRRIAEIAHRHEVPVLEDIAYAARLRDEQFPAPLAAFAHGAEVLTVGSLAKVVWVGLRIGWIRAPAAITERLARLKALADLGSPVLDQALAARLLPRLTELSQERAPALRRRLEHLCAQLSKGLPEWRWRVPDGGSALWVDLSGVDAQVFAQVALRHGVEVVPGAAMDPSGAHDSFLRVPYTFEEETLTELVHRLRGAWADLRGHGPAAVAAPQGG